MEIEVTQNEKISVGGKGGGSKRVDSAIRRRRANGGSVNIKKKKRGRVVWRDVDPYIIKFGVKQGEREEVESSKKDKPCRTKMMTPPLACVASRERMPDREWVQSDRRAENPGIRKEEDKLRLDSWIQIRSTGWDETKCSSSVLLARRQPAFY